MCFPVGFTMKVLIVSHLALPHVGGVENLVDLEVRGLAAAGHEVVLLTSDGSGAGRTPDYPPAVRMIRVPAVHYLERKFGIPYPLFGPRLVFELPRWIAWADVVHSHGFMFPNSALAVLLAKLQGKRSILTDHGGIQQFGSKLATLAARIGAETVGRLSAGLADRLVAYNGRIQRTLNKLGRRKDAEFVPNPVDETLFYPPAEKERAAARAALGWPADRKKVLFVGRLIAAKGVKLLLESGDPSFDLVFCGPGDPAILGTLPPGTEIHSPRPQAELRTLYHAADTLALPAQVREGFPLVVQEAVACGLPVVLGDDPGFAPYRGLPGLILCQRTPAEVRAAIHKALSVGATIAGPGHKSAGFFPSLERWVARMFPPTRAEVSLAVV